ncbi:MAG: tRNA lysidine(34) synthetase TilS [Eubacteriales bacterium]|nr:tRNA lysidine(34) synthetase TilS [Eubacteriales bacterium]
MDKLINEVLKRIRKEAVLRAGDAVLVGFSGGADSVCLLDMLASVRRLLKIEVYAMHINHQLRGDEAERDELFCREFAREAAVDFTCKRLDVLSYQEEKKLSLEEAARILRYDALEQRQKELSLATGKKVWIATAHHADDQAETILMNMLRGSGLKGMGGMRPARDCILRPLLGIGKKDILAYIERNSLSYVTDSTNLCNDYTRNKIRNEILPVLNRDVNTRASEHINSIGDICREADDYFTRIAREYIENEAEILEDGRAILLNQNVLKEKDKIIRRYVIIEGLRSLNIPLKDWGERHFEDIDALLFMSKGAHVDLPGKIMAENKYKETIIYNKF